MNMRSYLSWSAVCVTCFVAICCAAIHSNARSLPGRPRVLDRAQDDGSVQKYEPQLDPTRIPRQPYHRYTTLDKLGRTVTFYLSEEPAQAEALPLVVYVQGSGWGSLFAKRGQTDPNEAVAGQGGHSTLADIVRGRARLLIVEKPGVEYLDVQNSNPPQRFREEHTLDRWGEAVGAAVQATCKLAEVDNKRVLVIGHSEGGIVAARVAAERDFVTHVAVMAGGGPTQLYDILQLARAGEFFTRVSADADERVAYVLNSWAEIKADPDNAEKLFFGHPYRRWSTFLASSTMEELARTNAAILLLQGEKDRAVATETMTMAQTHLLSKGKLVTARMIADADHSFNLPPVDGEPVDGWQQTLKTAVDWFLAEDEE